MQITIFAPFLLCATTKVLRFFARSAYVRRHRRRSTTVTDMFLTYLLNTPTARARATFSPLTASAASRSYARFHGRQLADAVPLSRLACRLFLIEKSR